MYYLSGYLLNHIISIFRKYIQYPHIRTCAHDSIDGSTLPDEYKDTILQALSYFPELKNVCIYFVLRKVHQFPFSSKPDWTTLLGSTSKRIYIVTIGSESDTYFEPLLYKNLSTEARIGIIGHELSHIVEYHRLSTIQIILFGLSYIHPRYRTLIEKRTDLRTIQHGLGKHLLEYARYADQQAQRHPRIAKRRYHYMNHQDIKQYVSS